VKEKQIKLTNERSEEEIIKDNENIFHGYEDFYQWQLLLSNKAS
jgi:hypothetical protein